jgi:hypothetical protein
MKETTPAAMPPCFDRWCKRFDALWTHQAQKREFKNYIGGLLGESERKDSEEDFRKSLFHPHFSHAY